MRPPDASRHCCPMLSRLWLCEEPRGSKVANRILVWATARDGSSHPNAVSAMKRIVLVVRRILYLRFLAEKQIVFPGKQPARAPLHDNIVQPPLWLCIGVNRQGSFQQGFKFGTLLLAD